MEAGYRVLDHTADLALESFAPTPEAALAEAARGLCAQLCDPATVAERRAVALEARGADPETRLVHFLQEALAAWHLERMLLARFEVEPLAGDVVRGRGFGEPFDPARHEILGELKAVTYHQARFAHGADGLWRAFFVVDI